MAELSSMSSLSCEAVGLPFQNFGQQIPHDESYQDAKSDGSQIEDMVSLIFRMKLY